MASKSRGYFLGGCLLLGLAFIALANNGWAQSASAVPPPLAAGQKPGTHGAPAPAQASAAAPAKPVSSAAPQAYAQERPTPGQFPQQSAQMLPHQADRPMAAQQVQPQQVHAPQFQQQQQPGQAQQFQAQQAPGQLRPQIAQPLERPIQTQSPQMQATQTPPAQMPQFQAQPKVPPAWTQAPPPPPAPTQASVQAPVQAYPPASAPRSSGRAVTLPSQILECENQDCAAGHIGGNVGTWQFTGQGGTASWASGAAATMELVRFDEAGVEFHRVDAANSSSAGLAATYIGQITGDQIDGNVTWVWKGFPEGVAHGVWHAKIGQQQLNTSAVIGNSMPQNTQYGQQSYVAPPQINQGRGAQSPAGNIYELATSCVWRFGRTDGSTIATAMKLSPDGRITGYSNANENSWSIESNELIFRAQSGQISTRFSSMGIDPSSGQTVLTGSFLLIPAQHVTHVLNCQNIQQPYAGQAQPTWTSQANQTVTVASGQPGATPNQLCNDPNAGKRTTAACSALNAASQVHGALNMLKGATEQ